VREGGEQGRATWRRAAALGAVVFLVFACGGIDDNELNCEEALAHLFECCPGFEPRRFQCEVEETCSSRTPDLYDDASTCIRELPCDELRRRGQCEAFIAIQNEPYPNQDPSRIEQEACK
jgi:hypothetical protein